MTEIVKLLNILEKERRAKIHSTALVNALKGDKPFEMQFWLHDYPFHLKYDPPRPKYGYGAFMTVNVANGSLLGIFSAAESVMKALDRFDPKRRD